MRSCPKTCLLIGNSGSGAKRLYQSGMLKRRFGEVVFCEKLYDGLRNLYLDETIAPSVLNRFQTIIIMGCLSEQDSKFIQEFLFENIIIANRPLRAFVPTIRTGDLNTAIVFVQKKRKGDAVVWEARNW